MPASLKIEYNGEILSLNAIAKKEGINGASLGVAFKALDGKGTIYDAVATCKANQSQRKEKIIYYQYGSEKKTASQIAKLEGIDANALRAELKKTPDIEEAVKNCKERQTNNRDLNSKKIEYNGETLSIREIARRENLDRSRLGTAFNKNNGDIKKAIKICKVNQATKHGTVQYNGQMMTVKAIAESEGLSQASLAKTYKALGDIDAAIAECKKNKVKLHGTIQYGGTQKTLTAIAKEEEINYAILRDEYENSGDIYEAVRICKERQDERRVQYGNESLSMTELSNRIGVAHQTLKSWFEKTGNIDKAVLICQNIIAERARKQAKISTAQYKNISYYDLSLILGIEYRELKTLLVQGYTVDQILKMNLKPTIHKNIAGKILTKLPNGQSLAQYCIENGLNYACIYRAINTYGKSLTDAVDYYKHHGQQVPTTWIYEKYGVLLKHLLLRDHVDIDSVVGYMRKEVISLEDAVKKYIIKKNSKKDGLYDEWMEELYDVLTDEGIKDEYDEYIKTFYVDKKEEDCIKTCHDEVEGFKRKQLLFDIAEVLHDGTFAPDEEPELLKMYNITPDEIDIIFTDLYERFEDPGILMGEYMQKVITPQEIQDTNNKIAKYKQMIQDNQILEQMRATVKENVANNQETRTEIDEAIRNNEEKNNETNDDQ